MRIITLSIPGWLDYRCRLCHEPVYTKDIPPDRVCWKCRESPPDPDAPPKRVAAARTTLCKLCGKAICASAFRHHLVMRHGIATVDTFNIDAFKAKKK